MPLTATVNRNPQQEQEVLQDLNYQYLNRMAKDFIIEFIIVFEIGRVLLHVHSVSKSYSINGILTNLMLKHLSNK